MKDKGRPLFLDEEFSLSEEPLLLRPSEYLVKPESKHSTQADAQLFVNGISVSDTLQGKCKDCWFLMAVACCAKRPDLIGRLFVSSKYADLGMYTVAFHKDGFWHRIVVDDRIPCHPDTRRPRYARSKEDTELWVCLLEKAYVKLHGASYDILNGGRMIEGLTDLTGGMACVIDVSAQRKEGAAAQETLWRQMEEWNARGCPMGSFVDDENPDTSACETRDATTGLVSGHGYSIIDVVSVDAFRLVKLRNPWGFFEWKGAWSDNWPGWLDHRSIKRALAHRRRDDGSFWMCFDDFMQHFAEIHVCLLFPASWAALRIRDNWPRATVIPSTVQYLLQVPEAANVHISLCQGDSRVGRGRNDVYYYPKVGLAVHEDKADVSASTAAGATLLSTLCRSKEVWISCKLQPGAYRILPYHMEAVASKLPSRFFLTVYADHPVVLDKAEQLSPLTTEQLQAMTLDGSFNARNNTSLLKAIQNGLSLAPNQRGSWYSSPDDPVPPLGIIGSVRTAIRRLKLSVAPSSAP